LQLGGFLTQHPGHNTDEQRQDDIPQHHLHVLLRLWCSVFYGL
jgi:hypothetical protein